MILKLILHVLELDCGHARQYAGTELSKSWALFYMCWCWTVALPSFSSPSVDIKARVCPTTCYCSLLSFHRPCELHARQLQPCTCPPTAVGLGALQSPGRSPEPSSEVSFLQWLAFHTHYISYIPVILASYIPHRAWEITSQTDGPSDSVS